MPRLRLLLAWLLMAALPLQGMAAASMLFCGSGAAGRIAQTESHPGHHAPGNAASEQGSHAHGAHAHGAHAHALHAQSDSTGHAGAGMDHAAADEGFTQGHSCPICAACSQAQAVGGVDPLPLASPAPAAGPVQAAVRVASRALTLPDKPPRA